MNKPTIIPLTTPHLSVFKEIKLFTSFSDTDLINLIKKGSESNFEAHSNIMIEGELTWGLYIILKGSVKVFKSDKNKEQNYDIEQLEAGDFFGDISLIDDNPRSVSVKTLTPTQVFFLSKTSFNDFLEGFPELKLSFYSNCVTTLVNRLRELDHHYTMSQHQLWEVALIKEGGNQ